MPEPTKSADKNLPTLVSELWDLIVTYAKQETVDPLKSLVRFVGFGLAGAVLLSLGVALLLLGGLRAAQAELSPHLTGSFSWVPYAMVVAACIIVAGLTVRAIGADRRRAERERSRLRARDVQLREREG